MLKTRYSGMKHYPCLHCHDNFDGTLLPSFLALATTQIGSFMSATPQGGQIGNCRVLMLLEKLCQCKRSIIVYY
jgi:hypothetical protein